VNELPDILARICDAKREEIGRLRREGDAGLLQRIEGQAPPRGFRAAIATTDRVALIAEIKRASPSAGPIRADLSPSWMARQYERGGARCLSVLTDAKFFQGSLEDLAEAREATSLPVLRKDFVLDEIQVLEARAWGADCVLLIVAALARAELTRLLARARELGMDALVEVHSRAELDTALEVGAEMVGVNNRDLRTFEVNLRTAVALAPTVPEGVTVVAESGIRSPADVRRLKACGVDAILVGESLVRSRHPTAAARRLSDI